MKRKHQAIDILKFYTKYSYKEWNIFLSKCLGDENINRLVAISYGLQAGMTDLADQGLNDAKIDMWFIRIQRSIEKTLKQIWRNKNNNPLYDPSNQHLASEFIADKRELDHKFEIFLKENRF